MSENGENNLRGLILEGVVLSRTRRTVGSDDKELITYKVEAGTKTYYIKDWQPDDYFPVGEVITVPIIVKAYNSKNQLGIDYTIFRKNADMRGVEF